MIKDAMGSEGIHSFAPHLFFHIEADRSFMSACFFKFQLLRSPAKRITVCGAYLPEGFTLPVELGVESMDTISSQ